MKRVYPELIEPFVPAVLSPLGYKAVKDEWDGICYIGNRFMLEIVKAQLVSILTDLQVLTKDDPAITNIKKQTYRVIDILDTRIKILRGELKDGY